MVAGGWREQKRYMYVYRRAEAPRVAAEHPCKDRNEGCMLLKCQQECDKRSGADSNVAFFFDAIAFQRHHSTPFQLGQL